MSTREAKNDKTGRTEQNRVQLAALPVFITVLGVLLACGRPGSPTPGFEPRDPSAPHEVPKETPSPLDFEPPLSPDEQAIEDELIESLFPELPPESHPTHLPSGELPQFEEEDNETEMEEPVVTPPAEATPTPQPTPEPDVPVTLPDSSPHKKPTPTPTPVEKPTLPTTEPGPTPKPTPRPSPTPKPTPREETRPTPTPQPTPAPGKKKEKAPTIRAFWDGRTNQAAKWTNYTVQALEKYGKELLAFRPADITSFCPVFDALGPQGRKSFWVKLISAIAAAESSYNPMTQLREKDIVDRSGKNVVSRGLLQISLESSQGYQCGFQNEDQLHHPRLNLECGVRILNRWIPKDAVVSGFNETSKHLGGARYWSVLRQNSSKLEVIRRLTYQTALCRSGSQAQ